MATIAELIFIIVLLVVYIAIFVFSIALAFLIQFIIAKKMAFAAAEKGYGKEAHAFLMCFFLGIPACIYVAALPDKKIQENTRIIAEHFAVKEDEAVEETEKIAE